MHKAAQVSLPLVLCSMACAGVALKPAADRVEVVASVPPACQSLGTVFGTAGGYVSTGVFTPNEKLAEGAMNDARNKAAEKGATHLVPGSTELTGTAATLMAIAYRCPRAP